MYSAAHYLNDCDHSIDCLADIRDGIRPDCSCGLSGARIDANNAEGARTSGPTAAGVYEGAVFAVFLALVERKILEGDNAEAVNLRNELMANNPHSSPVAAKDLT